MAFLTSWSFYIDWHVDGHVEKSLDPTLPWGFSGFDPQSWGFQGFCPGVAEFLPCFRPPAVNFRVVGPDINVALDIGWYHLPKLIHHKLLFDLESSLNFRFWVNELRSPHGALHHILISKDDTMTPKSIESSLQDLSIELLRSKIGQPLHLSQNVVGSWLGFWLFVFGTLVPEKNSAF